jgi:hypothetical protein
VARAFLDWCHIRDDDLVLEPAAGEGILVPDRPGVLAVELDTSLAQELRYWRPRATVLNCDFLALPPLLQVDVAVQNPPYSDGGEGVFIRRALDWAPRTCALVRTVALHGQERFELCWRFVQPLRIAILEHRPRFLGPGGVRTPHNPEADYMAIEAVLRRHPLSLEDYSDWISALTIQWVYWR